MTVISFRLLLSWWFFPFSSVSYLIFPSLSQQLLGTVVTSSTRWLWLLLSIQIEKWKWSDYCFLHRIFDKEMEWTLKYSSMKVICLFRNASECLHICLHSPVLHLISTGTEQLWLVSHWSLDICSDSLWRLYNPKHSSFGYIPLPERSHFTFFLHL